MNQEYKTNNEEIAEIDILPLVFKCLSKWPWILAFSILSVSCAFFYCWYATPIYEVSSSVLINDGDKRNSSSAVTGFDIDGIGIISNANSFDNEVVILQSNTLIRKSVVKLDLYIDYKLKQGIRYLEAYKKSPLKVWILPDEAANLTSTAKISLTKQHNGSVDLQAIIEDESYIKNISHFPALLSTPHGVFSFEIADDVRYENWVEEDEYLVEVSSPESAMTAYKAALSVAPSSKTTTIINISLKSSSRQKSIDFIESLIEEYNYDSNNDKNEVATKTAEFLNERIAIINSELSYTEIQLENFKKEAGITDIGNNARIALQESSLYNQKSAENNTQIHIVEFLKDYANDESNEYEVLPVNVGLSDAMLSNLIVRYNEKILERKQLLLTSSVNNPAVVNLDASILALRRSVLTTIESVERNLLIAQETIDNEAKHYQNRITNNPKQEREIVAISRQQEIQANLYLMLLQKHEENSLMLASTANNARIFDQSIKNKQPIAPNKPIILLAALFLGIVLPAAFIVLKELFRYKIESKEDVEKLTNITIAGIIPSVTKKQFQKGEIVVKENENDVMAEAFRALRTNLTHFILNPNDKVILITSSNSQEGKSFIAANLAISLALMGKKTIVVGLDIRKPGLNKTMSIKEKKEGLTLFLSNPNTELSTLIQKHDKIDNLSILVGGQVPPNPTELLSRDALRVVIETLRESYDYVILDSAPIGIVTDTQIIAKYADLTMYICRANYTHKAEYKIINDFKLNGKLPNVCTVINDYNINSSGYGIAKRYGYGKGYGYGYGTGYGSEYGYGYGYNNG
ncbi:MAG: polysaccharide biosynthesis tyrosine autokinase [Rikenellaceae bacterium]